MSVLKSIAQYFKTHKIRLLAVVVLIAIVTVLALLPAQILRYIVDEVIGNNKKLFLSALVFASTYVLIGIVTFIKDLMMLSTSQGIILNLRSNMMKHVQSLSYNTLINTDSGTLEAYFNNDVNSINELFTSGVINMVTDLLKMIGIVVSIFIYSVSFGLIILLIIPIIVLFTSFVRKRMLKAQLKTKTLEGNVNKILLENVENIEQLKVNKALNYATDKYDIVLNNHFKASQASNFYDAIFSPIMQLIRSVVVCGILLLCGFKPGFFGMSIGMVISGIILITDLFSPIENLGMEIQTIQKSVASIKRINSFFNLERDSSKEEIDIQGDEIIYDNVSFAYSDNLVIKDFNLKITKGEKIAFQGPSGVGKSTLMKLAIGLIKPTSGSVKINGIDNYLLSDNIKNKLFSIVYQDPFFSNGSIYEEISLGCKDISKKMVRDSLDKVGLNYINDLDEILNYNEYSSGELALFNIARIICRDSKIIFLDEMNSKIDPITSKNIINLINEISKNKIVISINHYGDILENARVIKLG